MEKHLQIDFLMLYVTLETEIREDGLSGRI